MKKKLILCTSIISFFLSGQVRRDGQNSIQIQYGYIPSKGITGNGSNIKLEYGRVIGEQGWLGRGGLFYQDYKILYDNYPMPYQKYGINAMAGFSYEGIYPLYINAFIGGYAGYENVNKGNQKDIYGATIPIKINNVTFGIVGTAELELVLWKKMAATVDFTQYYDLKSSFTKSNYAINAGLKFYLN